MRFSPSIAPADAGVMTIYQGATFVKPFTWTFVDPVTQERTPVDLTLASLQMQLRTRIDGDVLIDFAEAGYISITSDKDGQFEINIPAQDTETFNFNRGVFDIEVHFADGVVVRVMTGRMVLSREVTK